MYGASGDVLPRKIHVVFVAEVQNIYYYYNCFFFFFFFFFDEFCDPGCPRGNLLGINLPILLAVVREERCFAVENSRNLMQYVTRHCHAERYQQ